MKHNEVAGLLRELGQCNVEILARGSMRNVLGDDCDRKAVRARLECSKTKGVGYTIYYLDGKPVIKIYDN